MGVGLNFSDFAARCRDINHAVESARGSVSFDDQKRPSFQLLMTAADGYLESLKEWQAKIDASDEEGIQKQYDEMMQAVWNGSALAIDSAEKSLMKSDDYDPTGEVRRMARQMVEEARLQAEKSDALLHDLRRLRP